MYFSCNLSSVKQAYNDDDTVLISRTLAESEKPSNRRAKSEKPYSSWNRRDEREYLERVVPQAAEDRKGVTNHIVSTPNQQIRLLCLYPFNALKTRIPENAIPLING
jgi:hypothetical protein